MEIRAKSTIKTISSSGTALDLTFGQGDSVLHLIDLLLGMFVAHYGEEGREKLRRIVDGSKM